MITEGEAAIPQETTQHAFRNQEKTKINYRKFYNDIYIFGMTKFP